MSKDTKAYRSCHPSVAIRRWELGLFRGQKRDPWLFCHPSQLRQVLLLGCAPRTGMVERKRDGEISCPDNEEG